MLQHAILFKFILTLTALGLSLQDLDRNQDEFLDSLVRFHTGDCRKCSRLPKKRTLQRLPKPTQVYTTLWIRDGWKTGSLRNLTPYMQQNWHALPFIPLKSGRCAKVPLEPRMRSDRGRCSQALGKAVPMNFLRDGKWYVSC